MTLMIIIMQITTKIVSLLFPALGGFYFFEEEFEKLNLILVLKYQ